jgi:diadenosine tetraphosphate (Ap4A) HIT family hydrolase
MNQQFVLDDRLSADTEPVAQLALSDLRLMNDARFPWLILVPRRPAAIELIDLDATDQRWLLDEIGLSCRALQATTSCDKLNVGALGNIVRQLHIHVVARFADDPAWPGPVWGAGAAVAYDDEARDRLIGLIRAALPR